MGGVFASATAAGNGATVDDDCCTTRRVAARRTQEFPEEACRATLGLSEKGRTRGCLSADTGV
jgi:hypothetical protein